MAARTAVDAANVASQEANLQAQRLQSVVEVQAVRLEAQRLQPVVEVQAVRLEAALAAKADAIAHAKSYTDMVSANAGRVSANVDKIWDALNASQNLAADLRSDLSQSRADTIRAQTSMGELMDKVATADRETAAAKAQVKIAELGAKLSLSRSSRDPSI